MTSEQKEALQAGLAEAVGYAVMVPIVGAASIALSYALLSTPFPVTTINLMLLPPFIMMWMISPLARWFSRRHLFGITRPRAPWFLLYRFGRRGPDLSWAKAPAWHTAGEVFYWPGLGAGFGFLLSTLTIIQLLAHFGADDVVVLVKVWASPIPVLFMTFIWLGGVLYYNAIGKE